MKKSIAIIFFFSFLLMKVSHAQTCDAVSFQNIYFNKNVHDTRTKNLFFTQRGNMYITGYTQSAGNGSVDAWVMKTTARGTPLWSKAIGTSSEEVINGIKKTMDDGFIFVGSTRHTSVYNAGWIAKTDSSGLPQWSVSLGVQCSSLSQVVQLRDGSYAAVGSLFLEFSGDGAGNITGVKKSTNIIIRFDRNGNTLWWRSFHFTDRETLNTIVQLKDGNLMVTGNVTGGIDAYLIKMKQENGDMIWMNAYQNTMQFTFARCIEMSDGTIHLSTANRIYYFTADGRSMPGRHINLNSNNISLDRSEASDIGTISPGIEVFFANLFPKPPVLFAVKNDSIVVWAHTYKQDTQNLQRFSSGKIYNNSIYLTGAYLADTLSDGGSKEYLSYLIKAGSEGKTLCSDTFNISFNISSIDAVPNISHGWQYEGTLKPAPLQLYSENLVPVRLSDCSVQTCCTDTIINKTDLICQGGTYALPGGLTAKEPGQYISALSTVAGCDSIVYTNLSLKKQFNFSLGSDTCLINNMAVTFNLPIDSSVQYRWQDGSVNSNYTANFPGEYWVTANAACNSVTDSVKIYDGCAPLVFIPSAFTPDNDGLNDVFRVLNMQGQHLLNFSIYNRYGQFIFFTADVLKGWNGTIRDIPQAPGTYVYFIKYLDLAGKPHQQKGTIVLIR
jgi:gliding motility-associated-like protein